MSLRSLAFERGCIRHRILTFLPEVALPQLIETGLP